MAAEALRAASEQLQALQPAGVGQLASALQDLQAALSDNVTQLSALAQQQAAPTGASSGSTQQVMDRLADVAAQLQQVASQVQQAAAAATSLELQLELPALPASQVSAGASLDSQLAQLSTATYAGYSLQSLALISAGVAALVALSVPKQQNDDDLGGGSGTGSGGSRLGSSGSSSLGSMGSSMDAAAGDALPTTWDSAAVEAYYRRRPTLVARRCLEVATEAVSYGVALLTDMATGGLGRGGWFGWLCG